MRITSECKSVDPIHRTLHVCQAAQFCIVSLMLQVFSVMVYIYIYIIYGWSTCSFFPGSAIPFAHKRLGRNMLPTITKSSLQFAYCFRKNNNTFALLLCYSTPCVILGYARPPEKKRFSWAYPPWLAHADRPTPVGRTSTMFFPVGECWYLVLVLVTLDCRGGC